MPMYLAKFSYTPEAWKNLIDNPEDRREPVTAVVEAVGGKLHGLWYAFGEHDGYCVVEAPDNISAAALALTATSGEGIRSTEMTVLMTVDELLESLRKASELNLQPPGG
jgi:uncharacterized protein with GYD domain